MTYGVQINFCRFGVSFAHLAPLTWNKSIVIHSILNEPLQSLSVALLPVIKF